MSNTNKNVDEAIARAKAAVREQASFAESCSDDGETESVEARESRQEAARAAKKARDEARDRIREQKKAEREAERSRKRTEREAKKAARALERARAQQNRAPAHMSKVEKAAAKLPQMNDDLSETFENLTDRYSVSDLSVLIAHLQLANRARQTLASHDVEFEEGQQVRIVSSENDASLIGLVGTVAEMRKIRVLLDVESVNKPVYLFAADCEALEEMKHESAKECDATPAPEEVTVDEETGFLAIESDDNDEEEHTGTDG